MKLTIFLLFFFTAFDYCNNIKSDSVCSEDKGTMCDKMAWLHLCLKTCACEFTKHILLVQVPNNDLLKTKTIVVVLIQDHTRAHLLSK